MGLLILDLETAFVMTEHITLLNRTGRELLPHDHLFNLSWVVWFHKSIYFSNTAVTKGSQVLIIPRPYFGG